MEDLGSTEDALIDGWRAQRRDKHETSSPHAVLTEVVCWSCLAASMALTAPATRSRSPSPNTVRTANERGGHVGS
jgi:hypothetical protein